WLGLRRSESFARDAESWQSCHSLDAQLCYDRYVRDRNVTRWYSSRGWRTEGDRECAHPDHQREVFHDVDARSVKLRETVIIGGGLIAAPVFFRRVFGKVQRRARHRDRVMVEAAIAGAVWPHAVQHPHRPHSAIQGTDGSRGP